ncbi:MAG: hypothetical protein GVY30_07360 [Chloroflexi bacterium]|jgi:uncharacterized coiled-coil DUF342 family protein|nr:hypothetical protein [Chloroflexota bacterium]
MSESRNEGIIVNGGTFQADQVSVGKHSQVYQTLYKTVNDLETSDKHEVAQAIAELAKAIEAHKERLEASDELMEVVKQIAEESQKDNPNKLTLKGLLKTIKEVVSPIAEISSKIFALQQVLSKVLGVSLS